MRNAFYYPLITAIVVLAGVYIWRIRAGSLETTASQFKPTTVVRVVVPAGTQIPAVLKNLFTPGTKAGDAMLAFVTDPVTVNGSLAIPAGTRLDGVVEKITQTKSRAMTWIRFNSLVIGQNSSPMKTDPVLARASVDSDFEVLGDAADTLIEAGIGASMGAAGRNGAGINAGIAAGALRGASGGESGNTEITVVLAQPMEVIR